MNKVSIALLSCCLALSGTLALADDNMSGDKMNNGGMSMEKSMSGDSMKKDSMKMDSGDKMMKKQHTKKHTMTHKKSKKSMHKEKSKDMKSQDTMQRMQ